MADQRAKSKGDRRCSRHSAGCAAEVRGLFRGGQPPANSPLIRSRLETEVSVGARLWSERSTITLSSVNLEVARRFRKPAENVPMPTVTVEGEKSFSVEPGVKLVLAIEDAGIDIMHRCGGNARCTTCRVQILSGDVAPMTQVEEARLAQEGSLGPDIRLSCQIRVESDVSVRVLNRASALGMSAGTRPVD
jgi:ferredoxin